MKVMLIAPPDVTVIEPFRSARKKLYPLVWGFPFALGYLAAVLEKVGIEVKIIDANTFSLTIPEIMNKVSDFCPDIVGMNCTTVVMRVVKELSKTIKQYDKNIKVVLGGAHVSFDYENILCLGNVDYVVIGEGEHTFLELCNRIKNGENVKEVKGLAFRSDGRIITTAAREVIKDLDTLPLPARHLVDFNKYISNYAGIDAVVQIISSRGCSHRCAFCSSGWLMKNWRTRSAENIMAELNAILKGYPQVRAFAFVDDNFCVDRNRVIKFCELIKQQKMHNFWWSCAARVDQLDDEMVDIMKSAGWRRFYLGIESGSENVLRQIGKGTNISQIKNTVKMLKRKNLEVYSFLMIGNPGETMKTIEKTKQLALDLKSTNSGWFITQVYPGTGLAKLQPVDNWLEYLYEPELEKPNLHLHPCVPCFTGHGIGREALKKIHGKLIRQFTILHIIRNFLPAFKKALVNPRLTAKWISYVFFRR